MSITLVIPARYGSQRLPAKALADIAGKPMVQWTYEKASQAAKFLGPQTQLWIATDDDRIREVAEDFGATVKMTSRDCASGTDRMASLLTQSASTIWVNIQGDEPMLNPEHVLQAVALVRDRGFDIGTLACPFERPSDLQLPSMVKVWFDRSSGQAFCFSREAKAYDQGLGLPKGPLAEPMRHLGLYVYRRESLDRFNQAKASSLEVKERLEQLRALHLGMKIGIAAVDSAATGVDTAEDLEKVRKSLV